MDTEPLEELPPIDSDEELGLDVSDLFDLILLDDAKSALNVEDDPLFEDEDVPINEENLPSADDDDED